MKLLIVIVCYRVVDLTIDCLRSLPDEVRSVPRTRVVVCENGTGGDAAERLARAIDAEGWRDWCELVAIHPNRGFTGGNNCVIRTALESADPPEYVLLLNADTIVRPGAIAELVRFMDLNPKVGISSSWLETPDGKIDPAAHRFVGVASEFNRGLRVGFVSRLLKRWVAAPPPLEDGSPVDWVAGASMIIRREVLTSVGLLDEGYFTYYDDIDYCRSATKAGWAVWILPKSRVVHLGGASTGISAAGVVKQKRLPSYWFQARRRYFVKHHGFVYAALADAAYILGLSIHKLRCWIQRKPDIDPSDLLRDSIRHSIFLTGIRLNVVVNPALAPPGKDTPQRRARAAPKAIVATSALPCEGAASSESER